MDIANKSFEERVSQERFNIKIDALLRIEFEDFFRLGQREKAKDVKVFIDRLVEDMSDTHLSNAEFRTLVVNGLARISLKL